MVNAFFQELFHTGIYKRNQGRISRQVTFAALAIAIALGLWRLSEQLITWGPAWRFGLPGILLMIGLWTSYRTMNVPGFAAFLIAVEAEMNTVSWPRRTELFRGSSVVLITIVSLAAVLFTFDAIWKFVFTNVLGIL